MRKTKIHQNLPGLKQFHPFSWCSHNLSCVIMDWSWTRSKVFIHCPGDRSQGSVLWVQQMETSQQLEGCREEENLRPNPHDARRLKNINNRQSVEHILISNSLNKWGISFASNIQNPVWYDRIVLDLTKKYSFVLQNLKKFYFSYCESQFVTARFSYFTITASNIQNPVWYDRKDSWVPDNTISILRDFKPRW